MRLTVSACKASTAQATEVYTATDYANILEYLVNLWNIESIEGLTPEAQKLQEYICKLPTRYKKLASRYKTKEHQIKLPWITK